MIINQEGSLVVPENTIAFFPIIPNEGVKPLDINIISSFLRPLNTDHKRDWFTPHFYKCLPLSIGNMQGFVFSLPYEFSVYWNGGDKKNDLVVEMGEEVTPYEESNFVYPTSEFGHGILTIHFPLTLKTPPGVNLMTIAPPNFLLPGLSPMTGVVESDNIRFSFTLNIKLDFPNLKYQILKDTPLAGIIPIPRYFCDSFELKNAYDIFDKNIVEEEMTVVNEHGKSRDFDNLKSQYVADKIYYSGKDVRGNKFKDHQLPTKNNNNV
jgi:hypothetical protein